MLDIQQLRTNLDAVAESLAKRGKPIDFSEFVVLETERKTLQSRTQDLQAQRNSLSKQIGMLKGKGEDASAVMAEVGGIGIAPGANLSDTIAMFEATHGTAPKYAGLDKVNPGSLILSAEMMLRHMGWVEAADLIIKGTEGAIGAKTVTYDFERLMEGAKLMSCSEFGDATIAHM